MNTNDNMSARGGSASGGKKILYIITQSELGGAQRYIFDLANNLKEKFSAQGGSASGWDISIAFGEQGDKDELTKQLDAIGIKYYTIPRLKRSISPINDFLAIIEITKLIKLLKPEIIHLNSSKVSILGSLAALISKFQITNYKLQTTYTVHGWVFNEPLPSWKKSFYFWAEKFTAFFKNKIICINKLDYELAKNLLNIKEEKMTLVYHGLRPINFLSREEAKEKLNSKFHPATLCGTKFIIGTIGNLYKTKGLEYLIEATKILKNSGLDITTVVIGEGDERKNLENLINKASLKNYFILTGKINNASQILPAFDIYVSSSVKEGFPYSILEAMAASLPIVATNVGGVPEMITDEKNGLLIPPQNPEELAKKIKTLIENKELRNILSQQAHKDAKEKFNLEKMVEKTKEVYLK